MDKFYLEVKNPRTLEVTPELMVQFLASLTTLKHKSFLFTKGIPVSLEITFFEGTIHFFIVGDKNYQHFIEAQILSQYPKALLVPQKDYLPKIMESSQPTLAARLKLQHDFVYPIKTFKDFKDVDPLSSFLGVLSKLKGHENIVIQIMLVPIGTSWQNRGMSLLEPKNNKEERVTFIFNKKLIQDKISYPAFKTGIRFLVKSDNPSTLHLLAASFASLNNPEGNSLSLSKPYFYQRELFLKSIINRKPDYIPQGNIMNLLEVATIFHFPGKMLSDIPNISWTKTILSEPPDYLPVTANLSEEAKGQVNFFANTMFRNQMTNFGIQKMDRRRHIYIIGKTGTGKSTLISNMAINDIRNGAGLAIIDPHGDLAETILDFIPSYRINDVVYLDPSDIDHPFHLNPLEITHSSQRELVASGIVAIFHKLYSTSWGPRLEYILRNTILTLLSTPKPTLLDIPKLLTEPNFRKNVVSKITDPVIRNYWLNEFEKMPDSLRMESISPILNKVGQFISSPMIRNIVGTHESSVDLEDIMNQGKILIFNLSQGRLGEDAAALLGAMTITKLQLAAMNRVIIPEEQRRDFYLYVDEFQNFATDSFIKILSEARKYHLDLILANQYTAQTTPEMRSAIFGNVGTLISFLVGAEDASYLAREFKERFKEEDLLALSNFQIIVKLAINSITSAPFLAQSLPLPNSQTQNREKIISVSRQRYAKSDSGEKSVEKITLPQNIKIPVVLASQGTIYFSKDKSGSLQPQFAKLEKPSF